MNSIHWYDWITPSNPLAAIVLGIIVIAVAALSYWFETKKVKGPIIFFVAGALFIIIGVYLLQLFGFYG